jgi:ferredoxin
MPHCWDSQEEATAAVADTVRRDDIMKVQLKQSLCDGFGTCAKHAPEVFRLDEWGYASVVDDGTVPAGAEDRTRRAIVDCPVNAIIEIVEKSDESDDRSDQKAQAR